jgi:predicted nucleic acid-binding protein
MTYTCDSSVALKWVLPEVDSNKAVRLREEFSGGVHKLIAPDFFSIEVAHSLTRAERQGRIGPGDTAALVASIMATLPRFARSDLLLTRAVEISSHMRVGVYDCVYVALAERRKCNLVTADDKLVSNLRSHFPFITPLSSLPGAT